MMLDDLGLGPTLNRYVGSFKDQTGLDVRVTSSGMEQRLPPYLEVMIFRAAQELLSNVVRHADASLVKLQLDAASGEVRVSIDDNGKGFDLKTLENSTGMGLKVIRDRVEMLGGEIDIDSVPGQGTRVVFSVPAKTG
jgi:two-component system sensor histidine kinase DegS